MCSAAFIELKDMTQPGPRLGQPLRRVGPERLDLATAIVLAGRAHVMRALGLVADRADVRTRRLETLVGPALVTPGLRRFSLWDSHNRPRSVHAARGEMPHTSEPVRLYRSLTKRPVARQRGEVEQHRSDEGKGNQPANGTTEHARDPGDTTAQPHRLVLGVQPLALE